VVHELSEAEQGALGLRIHWGLGLDPIPNLVEPLEERGIKVLAMDLPAIDGLTARVRRDKGEPASVIVVNQADWGGRQRFTVAHKLGHMVPDVAPKLNNEKAAHRFAGTFLMPAETLRAAIGRHRKSMGWGELFELKRVFGVSVQALTYRCKDPGIFSNSLFQSLFDEFARRTRSLMPMQGEKPGRFKRLCYRALVEGAVSDAKAAELLGISVRELNQRVEEPPRFEPLAA